MELGDLLGDGDFFSAALNLLDICYEEYNGRRGKKCMQDHNTSNFNFLIIIRTIMVMKWCCQ